MTTCIPPFTNKDDEYTKREDTNSPKTSPYTDKGRHSKKTSPYSNREQYTRLINPYTDKSGHAKKTSPYTIISDMILKMVSPYNPICIQPQGQFLLIDSFNFLLIDSAGHKLNINGGL